MLYLIILILAINLACFLLCGLDKRRAVSGGRRIPEKTLLLCGLLGGCFGLLLGMSVFRHKTRHAKFRILAPILCALWAVALIHAVSALTLDRQMQYLEISYASKKIDAALEGYTIAFVCDVHALPAAELQAVAERINGFAPDLLLLGGDFSNNADAMESSLAILSTVRATDGIYGVEGNHDFHPQFFAIMEKHGIIPLDNSGVSLREKLYLAGTRLIFTGMPDIPQAVVGADADDFVLLLTHNPDITMRQDTTDVDLVLSGHTHGGQITLFGLFAPALALTKAVTDYGQRFMSGWAKSRDGADVFVSNGTGSLALVPRVFARPQVILLTLMPGE